MATKIRLARCGTKKRPFYRLVVTDERNARDGRFIEIVGRYNPVTGVDQAEVKVDRVKHWLGCGAQVSDTAKQIIRKKVANQ